MIIDCFTFFNEIDMLECRLEYLNKKVDKFVLVEATITHSGKPKPMYFADNKNRFVKYLDKIIYVPVDIDPTKYDWTHDKQKGYQNSSWQVENLQRNSIKLGINSVPDDAIVMISDLDEVPNVDAIDRAIRMLKHKHFVSIETQQFYYNLAQCLIEPWPATVITKASLAKTIGPQKLRDSKNSMVWIHNGGWHLTYFGNAENIQNKIKNFAHQEYNQEKFTDLSYIEQKISAGEELYGRPFPMKKIHSSSFPDRFKTVFARYLPNQKFQHYAETVEGFFDLGDFEFYKKVVEHATDRSHFVEVGSYKGRSSAYMAVEIAQSGKSIQFDCVDTWEGSDEHQQGQAFEDTDVVNKKLYDVFVKNMEPVQEYYRAIRATSLEAATFYKDSSLDLVFIDAAHDYQNVFADITAWAPKVKSGGIISGHDWHHPPIKQAVNEILGSVNSIGNCWYIFKA